VTGLDLSPYMLAVAADRLGDEEYRWVHGAAEAAPFGDAAFDVISLQFVVHELPLEATRAILREALRICRPGGCVAVVDNNPASPVIRNLPPVLFTLMKSTEPYSDQYYLMELEKEFEDAGFVVETSAQTDPRHRTVVAVKP